jgi:hypothetical protein
MSWKPVLASFLFSVRVYFGCFSSTMISVAVSEHEIDTTFDAVKVLLAWAIGNEIDTESSKKDLVRSPRKKESFHLFVCSFIHFSSELC